MDRLFLLLLFIFVGLCASEDGIISKEYSLGGAVVFNMKWIGTDKQVVVIQDTDGKLHRSSDEGRTFHLVTSITHRVRFIESSSFDPTLLFVACEEGHNYMSVDGGSKFQEVSAISKFEKVIFHPKSKDLVIASARSKECPSEANCRRELFYSKDSGLNWVLLDSYVEDYSWAPFPEHDHGIKFPLPSVYFTANEKKSGKQRFGILDKSVNLYVSMNFGKPVLLLQSANRIDISGRFLFASVFTPETESKMSLYSSYDGVNFLHNSFPEPVDDSGFEIVDSSSGAAFISTHHSGFSFRESKIYKTDSRGMRPSTSINKVNRNAFGRVDFSAVPSMDGVYIANQIDSLQDGELRTFISFDNGGRWMTLKAPATNYEGKPIKCGLGCSLHLHGILDIDKGFPPAYSVGSAVGLILASGNVGPYLYSHPDVTNTYLSRDGGVSWIEIRNGSYIYEFGDHGALLVMAPIDKQTDSIIYSWNEGITWKSYKFTSKPMDVDNVIIEPIATSQKFIIYGSRGSGSLDGIVVSVDFSGLHESECVGEDAPDTDSSDYETWTPAYPNGSPCVLGHETTYIRRIRESECYNGKDYERKEIHKNCLCTNMDYECDIGYERESDNSPCQPISGAFPSITPEEQCMFASTYTISSGYRRVVGDTCEGGLNLDPKVFPCAVDTPFLTTRGWIIVVILLLAVLVIVSAILYKHNYWPFSLIGLQYKFANIKYNPNNLDGFDEVDLSTDASHRPATSRREEEELPVDDFAVLADRHGKKGTHEIPMQPILTNESIPPPSSLSAVSSPGPAPSFIPRSMMSQPTTTPTQPPSATSSTLSLSNSIGQPRLVPPPLPQPLQPIPAASAALASDDEFDPRK